MANMFKPIFLAMQHCLPLSDSITQSMTNVIHFLPSRGVRCIQVFVFFTFLPARLNEFVCLCLRQVAAFSYDFERLIIYLLNIDRRVQKSDNTCSTRKLVYYKKKYNISIHQQLFIYIKFNLQFKCLGINCCVTTRNCIYWELYLVVKVLGVYEKTINFSIWYS